MAIEANMMAVMTGYGPHTLHLMREEELLNVQNKTLVSKTSFLC